MSESYADLVPDTCYEIQKKYTQIGGSDDYTYIGKFIGKFNENQENEYAKFEFNAVNKSAVNDNTLFRVVTCNAPPQSSTGGKRKSKRKQRKNRKSRKNRRKARH